MCLCTTSRWDWADNTKGSQQLRYYCRSRREANLNRDPHSDYMLKKRLQDRNSRSCRIHQWVQNPMITQKRQIFSKKTNPEEMHWAWKWRRFSQCVIINPEAAILGISSPINKVLALQISNIAAQLSPSLRLYNSVRPRKGFGVSQTAKSNYKSGSKLHVIRNEKRRLWLAKL